MNSDQISSNIRALLTIGATWLVTKGYFTSEAANDIIGAVVLIATRLWSYNHHATPKNDAPTS